jgi:hypothetical protein
MVWTTILLLLLRIALPFFVGYALRILIEGWQTKREEFVTHQLAKA